MKAASFISPVFWLVIKKMYFWVIIILFIYPLNTLRGQQEDCLLYDGLTQKYVYTFVEKMPGYKGGDGAFFADFSKYFHYVLQANEDIQTKLQVQFVIDKEGHLIGARIYNKEKEKLTDFEKAGLKALQSMQNWEAGTHKGKNVDVIVTKMLYIDFDY